MDMKLHQIWNLPNQEDYKLHFARWNGVEHPLDVRARSKKEWQGWQEYKGERDEFSRPFIFSLMQFYHEKDIWLFGGIFKVLERKPKGYCVKLINDHCELDSRLKLRSSYNSMAKSVYLENYYENFEVVEILREPYSGIPFPGLSNIELSFSDLEVIIKNERPEWKRALNNVGGIYLITDKKTGRRYVGAAYGNEGVWSRWSNYVSTGHGGNAKLIDLLNGKNLRYCSKHFHFALLEPIIATKHDRIVSNREDYWKKAILSRHKNWGLNKN